MGELAGKLELVTPKDFNIEFLRELKIGQVLGFRKGASMDHYKVVKIDKKRKQWWFQPWKVYTDEEFAQMERDRLLSKKVET